MNRQRSKGFTLLEVLIAIVITALIGLGSWQILNSAIRTNDQTKLRLDELAQLQRAMLYLERDFRQILARPIRDEYGDMQPALTTKNEFFVAEFSRTGWRNPLLDPRSELQRVAYELDAEGSLQRHHWLVMDRSQDSQSRHRLMLEGLETFKIEFLNSEGAWKNEWPQDVNEEPDDPVEKYALLPKAARVMLEHPRFGAIERVFELAQYFPHTNAKGAQGDSNESGSGSGTGSGSGSGGGGQSGLVGQDSDEQVNQ